MVAHREQAILAQRLIADTCKKQAIKPEQLVIHADRGPSMTSKPVAFLLCGRKGMENTQFIAAGRAFENLPGSHKIYLQKIWRCDKHHPGNFCYSYWKWD